MALVFFGFFLVFFGFFWHWFWPEFEIGNWFFLVFFGFFSAFFGFFWHKPWPTFEIGNWFFGLRWFFLVFFGFFWDFLVFFWYLNLGLEYHPKKKPKKTKKNQKKPKKNQKKPKKNQKKPVATPKLVNWLGFFWFFLVFFGFFWGEHPPIMKSGRYSQQKRNFLFLGFFFRIGCEAEGLTGILGRN